MKGLKILLNETQEFVEKGPEFNIVNPQSSAEDGFHGKYLTIEGQKKLDLTRLDYLALGSDPAIREIMIDCIKKYDIGCPCSQMVVRTDPTLRLERTLAEFHGMKESIVFTSGYSANFNVIQALGLRTNTPHIMWYFHKIGIGKLSRTAPTIFFLDGESHYSLLHGIRASKSLINNKCILNTFPSGDYECLSRELQKSEKHYGDSAVRIIVSDTLSSTSGKIFDMHSLCSIAEEHDCLLYLDEAHAVGTLGPHGKGIAADFKEIEKYKDRILIMGTLTKTLCQLGSYVASFNKELDSFLRACSPQYIFSAPVPPWMAEATIRIINLISGGFGEERRQRLKTISKYLRTKLLKNDFDILNSESQIIPALIGNQEKAEKIRIFLEQQGFLVSLFKYPAVPRNGALIRFSLCADITEEEIDRVMKTMLSAREKFLAH